MFSITFETPDGRERIWEPEGLTATDMEALVSLLRGMPIAFADSPEEVFLVVDDRAVLGENYLSIHFFCTAEEDGVFVSGDAFEERAGLSDYEY